MLKYVKSQRSYGFLITKELIFGFQILDLEDFLSLLKSKDRNFPKLYAQAAVEMLGRTFEIPVEKRDQLFQTIIIMSISAGQRMIQ